MLAEHATNKWLHTNNLRVKWIDALNLLRKQWKLAIGAYVNDDVADGDACVVVVVLQQQTPKEQHLNLQNVQKIE